MQKITLFIFLFLLLSCSPTINRPLYKKSEDPKSLILSKYGEPSGIKIVDEQEKWIYDYSSVFKSNRTVIFDNRGKIIVNKKHYKHFHMITGLNKHSYIASAIIIGWYFVFGPFPALL